MKDRLNYKQAAPKSYEALLAMDEAVTDCGIEKPLLYMLFVRVSQINGCAFCTDMHWKDSRHAGLSEQKLSLLTCWRESTGFTDRERAALQWAESITDLSDGQIPDSAFDAL